MDMVIEYPPIRIVSPAGFDLGTAQTPGSVRLAAVAPQLGIQSALWGGLFQVKPGAHCAPVRLSRSGRSLQFGRTSAPAIRLAHKFEFSSLNGNLMVPAVGPHTCCS